VFEKYQILIIIFLILIVFYAVISLGAGNKEKKDTSRKIKKYLFGVRILILIIAIVSLILWSFA
jgi:Na+/H+ antiporter NhaC